MDRWTHPFVTSIEVDGTPSVVEIARLTFEEYGEFRQGMLRLNAGRGVPPRGPDDGALSDAQVWARHDAARTAEEEARDEARELARQKRNAAWLRQVISDYVRFPDGAPGPVAGVVIHSGAELLEWYGTRELMLSALVSTIWAQNTLDEATKKNLPPPDVLLRRYLASQQGTPGDAPAPTADSAATRDSQSPAAATDASATDPSGTTTAPPASLPEPVPSAG